MQLSLFWLYNRPLIFFTCHWRPTIFLRSRQAILFQCIQGTAGFPNFVLQKYRYFLQVSCLLLSIIVNSCGIAHAQSLATQGKNSKPFNRHQYENVIATAMTFLQPRTLDQHSIKELSLWGLNGLNAIDPSFSIHENQGQLLLNQTQNTIGTFPLPMDQNDIAEWSRIVTEISIKCWNSSSLIQSATMQGVTQAFFDELFDHMDPYSRYIAPGLASTDRDERGDGDANIGITLEKKNGLILIASINTNGPAWTAGVNIGEKLYKVDRKRTSGQSVNTVNDWLKGAIHSPLTLTLGAKGTRKVKTISLKREIVPPATVSAFTNDNIIILKIASFSTFTAEEINQYLDQATQDMKLKGLILDLRGNRGGVLQQAITSAALLLDHGIAATTQGRDPESNHVWAVQGGDLTNNIPIIVLVDGRTASAAEILTATLSDHKRAVVIGSTTLGKGLVQTIAQMPDGGELFVTWSRVIAPLGWPIQGLGILPQICTSHGQQFIQQQLNELKENRSSYKRYIIASRQARFPMEAKDILQIRNACPPALGSNIDLDIANTLISNQNLYQKALDMIPSE